MTVLAKHSAPHVAHVLAVGGFKAGLLNPSDAVAVRKGHVGARAPARTHGRCAIGMYWDSERGQPKNPDVQRALRWRQYRGVQTGPRGRRLWVRRRHVAVEEYLAVATTMLTMNRYVNKDLWSQAERWIRVTLPVGYK